jgi:hypothetical protein
MLKSITDLSCWLEVEETMLFYCVNCSTIVYLNFKTHYFSTSCSEDWSRELCKIICRWTVL